MHIRHCFFAVAALSAILFTGSAAATDRTHPSGLTLLGRQPLPPQNPEALAQALDRLEYLSERYPEDLAYPWVDHTNGRVVIGAVTEAGVRMGSQPHLDANLEPVVPHVPRVRFSRAQLNKIQSEVHTLETAGVPDADLIWMSHPDPEHNRIVVTIERASDALLYALAARYGAEAVAVDVNPNRARLMTRRYDVAPFWGGAGIAVFRNGERIGYCSTAFGWDIYFGYQYTGPGMLTAGHCATAPGGSADVESGFARDPDAGDLTYVGSKQYIGSINSSRSNWTSTGTRQLPDDARPDVREPDGTLLRGDMALIESPTNNIAANLYTGAADDLFGTNKLVTAMWGRRSQVGDRFCHGGARTGKHCGWVVTKLGADVDYPPFNGVIKNGVAGEKFHGISTDNGDSGGSIFTELADGTVAAKGIIHGSTTPRENEDGLEGDPLPCDQAGCTSIFTDIRSAYWGFPGRLLTYGTGAPPPTGDDDGGASSQPTAAPAALIAVVTTYLLQ